MNAMVVLSVVTKLQLVFLAYILNTTHMWNAYTCYSTTGSSLSATEGDVTTYPAMVYYSPIILSYNEICLAFEPMAAVYI